jgi:hypothetical protein
VGKRETVQALGEKLKVDVSSIQQVLDVREHKANPKSVDVNELFARYLSVVEHVTTAVDEALDTPAGS